MAELIELDSDLIQGFEPERPEEGHKNTFGTALICAGSEYMTGAAVMAAGAALRSGVGLVKVFSEDKTLNAVSCNEPCAILELRPKGTVKLLRRAHELCKTSDAVLIGSGIPSDYEDLEALVTAFVEEAKSLVLDAGALTLKPDAFMRIRDCLKRRTVPAVITPHIGEFSRMTGISKDVLTADPDDLLLEFAASVNVVTVLKSYKTVIATPDGKLFVNDAPNSGLSKGGSGDVLAGLITGLSAQGMEPHEAACSAVFIHSKAGEAAADDLGKRSMLPTDLEFYLKDAFLEAGWD